MPKRPADAPSSPTKKQCTEATPKQIRDLVHAFVTLPFSVNQFNYPEKKEKLACDAAVLGLMELPADQLISWTNVLRNCKAKIAQFNGSLCHSGPDALDLSAANAELEAFNQSVVAQKLFGVEDSPFQALECLEDSFYLICPEHQPLIKEYKTIRWSLQDKQTSVLPQRVALYKQALNSVISFLQLPTWLFKGHTIDATEVERLMDHFKTRSTVLLLESITRFRVILGQSSAWLVNTKTEEWFDERQRLSDAQFDLNVELEKLFAEEFPHFKETVSILDIELSEHFVPAADLCNLHNLNVKELIKEEIRRSG